MSLDEITKQLEHISSDLRTSASVDKSIHVSRKGEEISLSVSWEYPYGARFEELAGVDATIKSDMNKILKRVVKELGSIGLRPGRPSSVLVSGESGGKVVISWRAEVSNGRRQQPWPLQPLDDALKKAIESVGYRNSGFWSET